MGKDRDTRKAAEEYYERKKKYASDGRFTSHAEHCFQTAKSLHKYVDPSAEGVVRRSICRMQQVGDHWQLLANIALLIEIVVDATGSMGQRYDSIIAQLPRQYGLLLDTLSSKYDPQVINGVFNDRAERPVFCRSMAEVMASKILDQLSYMVPLRDGGDTEEDPDYALFAAAYLTDCVANYYGLKTYHFVATDAPGRGYIDENTLKAVFGDQVIGLATENAGYTHKSQGGIIRTSQIVGDLFTRVHAFVLHVGDYSNSLTFWRELYGSDRVIRLYAEEYLPETQAVAIGLTEGIFDLTSAEQFLLNQQISRSAATAIVRSVSHIPLNAQTFTPNFHRIPREGDMFKIKLGTDRVTEINQIWPVPGAEAALISEKAVTSVLPRIEWL